MKNGILTAATALTVLLSGCSENNGTDPVKKPNEYPENNPEVYAGGELGTTFNSSASAYQDPAPAVENAGMENEFKYGEYFFERTYNQMTPPFNGLGPLYVRSSCIDCHPGYGHGRRVDEYRANQYGNGYLLVLYDKTTDSYLTSVTGMPQTKAVEPFKAPLDETKIKINWIEYTDEWGNKFPDGTTYSLIYPEVTIPADAYYVPIQAKRNGETVNLTVDEVGIRLESTIGVYGVGLIDAIPDDSLKVQYAKEEKYGAKLNPSIFKNGEWVGMYSNSVQGDGTRYAKKLTYALSRGPLQDGPGANAIWNITNVTRSDRRYHYMTAAYAETASKDPEVQAVFYQYFPDWNKTGDPEKDIYNYLMNKELPAEMSDEDYVNFMIWHRGLAVPAARNLEDEDIQLGRKLFREIGCALCHRPSWKTGPDEVADPNNFFSKGDKRLPKFPYQTIWPYTDLIQHRLCMKNDIRTGWCRTTPLWGRGLSAICAGHQDRLHDCRARNVNEAIMWHGSAESDARASVEAYRKLSSEERDAIVKFINAI
jgi:CxxC motif-containing protein (DUF1111 family)